MANTKSWLSNLKIRASYGLLGNQDALSDYCPALNTYDIGYNYPFGGALNTGYAQSSYKLSTITWEKSTTWGVGLDFGFLNNKITGSLDFYDRKTTGILMQVSVPTEFALNPYVDNVGSMDNRGVELNISYHDRWGDWTFGVAANFAYNKNKILDLGGRKFFDAMMSKYTLKPVMKRSYHRDSTMSKAEIMLIMILFHDSGYRCLKHFYIEKVCKHMRHLFPKVVSYNRFVELEKEVAIPLALFIKKVLLGKCTGISFVDSTPLRVCRNQRIHIHKTFKGIAQRGKCSMGWFFGFKLHLICNECGELLNFMITPGDVDDRKPLEYKAFVEFIYGKLVGDKGYIGKNLFKRLFVDGIQLITKLKRNMKGALMSLSDKLLLRKRAIIETVNDELKNIAQVEDSRHWSFDNFIVNLLGAMLHTVAFRKSRVSMLRELLTHNSLCFEFIELTLNRFVSIIFH